MGAAFAEARSVVEVRDCMLPLSILTAESSAHEWPVGSRTDQLGLEERNVTSTTTTCSSVHLSNRRSLVAISCHSTTCANGEVWLRPRTALRLRPRPRRSSASSVWGMRSLRHPAGGCHRDDSRRPTSSYSMEVKPRKTESMTEEDA
jgi:hypothetical protein